MVAACGPGTAGIVLVGPAGVGKTRIAEVAIRRLRQRGRDARIVMATGSTSSVPFGAFGAYSLPVDPTGDLVTAVCAILGARSRAGATACLIDDAQLLDERSASLVRRLVVDRAVTLILTIRSGEPVPQDITALWRDGHLRRLDVGHLDETELIAAAEASLGGALDSFAAARLTSLSGGNVMYFRQLVEGQREAGHLMRVGEIWRWDVTPGVPPGLSELITDRLADLPQAVGEVLDLVALAEPLELAALIRLTSAEAAERAERHGVILIDEANGRLVARAAHPLFGEVAVTALPRLRARRLRGRIAEALAHDAAPDPVLTLRRAVLSLDADATPPAGLLTRGAALAVTAGDSDLADRLAGAALAAGEGFAAQNVRAFVRSWAGRDPGAADRELIRLAELARTPDEAVHAVLHRALHLAWGCAQPEAAVGVLDAGRVQWPDSPILLAGRSLIEVYWAGELRDAAGLLLDPNLPPEATALAATAVAAQAAACGRFATFVTATEQGLAAVALAGAPASFGVSVTPMAVHGYCLAGALDVARRIAGDRHREALGKEPYAQFVACMAGDAELSGGAVHSALRLFREAWAGFAPYGDLGPWRFVCAVGMCSATALLGDVDAAREWYVEAEARRQPSFALLDVDLMLAGSGVASAEGATQEAIDLALTAADLAGARSHAAYELLSLQRAVLLGAPGLAARVGALATVVDGPRAELVRLLATAAEQGDGAVLREASAGLERMGDLMAAGDAAVLACEAFQRSGAGVAAQESRVRVRRLIESAGGARTAAMARCVLALPLTGREWEIAELAAHGATSRQIATRLVLSARTVEGHLYRIYQKLGLGTRAELAAALNRGERME